MGNLKHIWVERVPTKSTLSYQNEHGESDVFCEKYHAVMRHLGQHVAGSRRIQGLGRPVKPPVSTNNVLIHRD